MPLGVVKTKHGCVVLRESTGGSGVCFVAGSGRTRTKHGWTTGKCWSRVAVRERGGEGEMGEGRGGEEGEGRMGRGEGCEAGTDGMAEKVFGATFVLFMMAVGRSPCCRRAATKECKWNCSGGVVPFGTSGTTFEASAVQGIAAIRVGRG